MSDARYNKDLIDWFYPNANKLAKAVGQEEWIGRIPILVEDAWNFQNEKIKQLEQENANLSRCLDGKPEHWSNIIFDKNKQLEQLEQENAKLKERVIARNTELRYTYPTIQKLEQENAKLKDRLKDAMSILNELNNDFDSMEHSYVGKDSDYHKRIKSVLKWGSDEN